MDFAGLELTLRLFETGFGRGASFVAQAQSDAWWSNRRREPFRTSGKRSGCGLSPALEINSFIG